MNVDVPELPAFEQAIVRYIRDLGMDSVRVIRQQGRLLLLEVMRLTPPKTRAQGRRAVAQDVKRAVRVIRPTEFRSKELRRLIRERDYPRLQAAFDDIGDGPLAGVRVEPFEPELHTKARNKRGVVPKGTRPVLTLDSKAVQEYIREVQDHVGRAKGGWAVGAKKLGGSVPAWVSRWSGVGKFEDRADNPVLSYIRADNLSEWTRRGDDDRVLGRAMEGRAKAIVGDIERRLARAANQNFKP